MRNLPIRSLAIAAGVVCATATGVTVASAAATPSATATPSSSATGAAHRHLRRVMGEVESYSATGGVGAGQLTLKEPGTTTTVTINLASQTKVWLYNGPGHPRTSEAASSIPLGDIVIVAGRTVSGNHIAVRILDTGFKAS